MNDSTRIVQVIATTGMRTVPSPPKELLCAIAL